MPQPLRATTQKDPLAGVLDEFNLPRNRVWLDAAHQGPLPQRAADAIRTMIQWKQEPHHLKTASSFTALPARLRASIARMIGAESRDVTLTSGASYGLHLIANGLDLKPGDEVIVAHNDFPSNILPWQRLSPRGIRIISIRPEGAMPSTREVEQHITSSTRVVCLSWVHSFSGHMIDVQGIGELCRNIGAWFVINGSQGIGALPFNVATNPVDALVGVGFKWLCGPYATGFCWLSPNLNERIEPQTLYWLNAISTDDLARDTIDLSSIRPDAEGRHDVFCPANFMNHAALLESIQLVQRIGIDVIANHNRRLADQLIAGLDRNVIQTLTPQTPPTESSIVCVRPIEEPSEEMLFRLAAHGIDVSFRHGMVRLSPHFYNTSTDIARALALLNAGRQAAS